MKLSNQQVGRAGEHFVAAEIHRRGGYAVMFTGNMPGIDMLASNRDNTHRVSIQVKTKGPNSGGRQASTRHGLSRESADFPLLALGAQRLAAWKPGLARDLLHDLVRVADHPQERRVIALAAAAAGEESRFIRRI